MEDIMKTREILLNATGATLRCINSDSWAFEIGKDYKTRGAMLAGLPDVEIGALGFSLNGYKGGFYKVEGSDRTIARFVMIKDGKGRYVKRSRYLDMMRSRKHGNIQDYRRLRRYARQMLKNDAPGSFSWTTIKGLSRNAGK